MLFNYRNLGRLWRVYGRSVVRYGTRRKLVNALRTELAYRRRAVDVTSRPYVLFIEPLYYCNLHCPLCPREVHPDARKGDSGKLPLDLIEQIFNELGDDLFQCHIFGNGEPMLDWPRTRAVIEAARRKRVFTLVSTNCTILNDRVADEVVTSGLDYLVCAIDGTSQASYETYRVGGRYDVAMANLRRLAAARDRHRSDMSLEWQFLVTRHNQHEMNDARRIARDLNVYLRFAPMGGTEAQPEQWLPSDGTWGQNAPGADGTPTRGFPCYWLWRGIVINANGQLGRCPGYSNVAQLGSIEGRDILAVYHGPETRRARELFVPGAVPAGDFPTPCATCNAFARCHGPDKDAVATDSARRVGLPVVGEVYPAAVEACRDATSDRIARAATISRAKPSTRSTGRPSGSSSQV